MIRIVIFDLDGTLVNAYPAIISSFNATMRHAGVSVQSDTVIKRAVGWGDALLLAPFIGKHDVKKVLPFYRRHHAKTLLTQARPLAGARRVLAYLKKNGYYVALATNRPKRFTHIILRGLGLRKYFDCVLCGDMVQKPKPHPGIVKNILARFGCKPFEALYVGDMTVDIETGRRARVKTAAVTTGSHNRSELKKARPTYLIKSVTSVIDIVKRSNSGTTYRT